MTKKMDGCKENAWWMNKNSCCEKWIWKCHALWIYNWWNSKSASKREVQGSGCGVGFVFRIFHELSLWKTNCRHNVISL